MDKDREDTEVVKHEDVAQVMEREGRFDLAQVGDPTAGLETAQKLVSYMAKKCTGEEYIATIQGKRFPRVDWWTTVGGALGLFPREESCRRLDRAGGEVAYEATVGVYNGDQLVTRASAICSSEESTWSGRDEYAIRSMAITRATGKAYRVGLSFLPVMAGLEPTPAEEMPQGASGDSRSRPSEQKATGDAGHTCPDCGGPIWDNRADKEAGEVSKKYPNFKCRDKECDWASWDSESEVFGTDEGYGWADDVKDAADPDTVREIENVLIELAAPFPDCARRAQERFDDLKAEGKLTQQKAEDALRQFREKLDEASEDDGPDKDEWDDRSDVLMWFENQYGDEWEAKLNLFLSRHPDLSTPHEKLDRMSWNRIKRFVDEHDRDGVEDPRQVLQTEAAL